MPAKPDFGLGRQCFLISYADGPQHLPSSTSAADHSFANPYRDRRAAPPLSPWRPVLVAALRGSRPGVRDLSYAAAVLSAIANTERFVPLGRCLGRALTGWLLLRRYVPTRLRVDVAWRGNRELLAHACLEVDGVALVA